LTNGIKQIKMLLTIVYSRPGQPRLFARFYGS